MLDLRPVLHHLSLLSRPNLGVNSDLLFKLNFIPFFLDQILLIQKLKFLLELKITDFICFFLILVKL
jgi:hypothetical protein